jgi:uncharacterized protein (TIGR02996 family)
MARPRTWFEQHRARIVDALATGGVRFVVLRPRLTAGKLQIEVDLDPANLARLEQTMVTRIPLDPQYTWTWNGLAAALTASPGEPYGFQCEFVAREPARARTDDHAELRAAIVERPDDDEPRRVFADWLIECGDPRGELIAVQCELARAPTPELERRATELLAAGWKAFAGELAPYCDAAAFERGFIAKLTMTMAAFGKHGAAFTREPVRTLALANRTWTAAGMEKLAATPALGHVRELRIACGPHTAKRPPLGPLGRSKHLRRLETLVIDFCGVSATDWRQLLELDAPALATLRLFYNHSSVALYEALAANPRLRAFRALRECTVGWVGRPPARAALDAAIAGLARRGSLDELALEQHALTDDAITPFFDRSTPATLRRLKLVGSPLTDVTARAIARSPKARELESLELHNSRLTVDGIRELLAAAPRLRRAAFTSAAWTDEQHAACEAVLLAVPPDHALREVGLWRRDGSPALRARYERIA